MNGLGKLQLLLVVLFGTEMLLLEAAPAESDGGNFTVRILHTNDMHSRFEQTSKESSICSDRAAELGKCYGGFARLATLIREARRRGEIEDLPTFFLNAGDTYQGSDLFTQYKWRIVAKFLEILHPDVASLGNHEFDNKVSGLVPFLENISFPVVAANLDLSDEPDLQQASKLTKSVILEAKGRKIGVIGYLTPDTAFLSQTGKVHFIDEVIAIREESKKLSRQGCDIIIALGHSGYETDKRIAREVELVDLVIGGHTNTFLYTGKAPDIENIEGLYPTKVKQSSGRVAYVVQAYAYTKYLGDLRVDFNSKGEIVGIRGLPKLVDSSVPMAEDVESELRKWSQPLQYLRRVIGSTKVMLDGSEKVCRLQECNFGNLLTDAMIYYNAERFNGEGEWTDAAIAIHQGGGIRGSVNTENMNKVTLRDIRNVLPFGEPGVFKVQVKGSQLREALEWGVYDRISQNETSHGGAFLQVSGIQVVFDVSKEPNSRVVSVRVRCSSCSIPSYNELDLEKTYSVLMPGFLYEGGDGFKMMKTLPYVDIGANSSTIVAEYINHTSPVYPNIEGRIQFVHQMQQSTNLSGGENGSAGMTSISIFGMLGIVLLLNCFLRI